MCLHPKSCIRWFHNADSKCFPRLVVTVDGTPYLEIYPWTKTCATVSGVILLIGKASGHRVKQSMQVNK